MQSLKGFAKEIFSQIRSEDLDESIIICKDMKAPYGRVFSISFLPEGENIATNIFLNDYYEDYLEGKDIGEIADDIIYRYQNELGIDSKISLSLLDFYDVMDHIIPIMFADNAFNEAYKRNPFTKVADDLCVYYVIEDTEDAKRFTINNSILEKWGISVEELHKIAINNIDTVLEPVIKPLNEMLAEIYDVNIEDLPDEMRDDTQIVVTSKSNVNGSVVLLSETVKEQLADHFGDDFFILPSSIHEVICIPTDGKDADELSDIVHEINANEVAPDEILADHVLGFNIEEMQLVPGNELKGGNKLLFTRESLQHDKAVKDAKERKAQDKTHNNTERREK